MNKEEITTYFFSHFPINYGKNDTWRVFQRWGRVSEVFIPRRLDKWGHRYGFVRFYDVKEIQKLQHDLDSIYIGSTKLHVNIPRYARKDVNLRLQQTKSSVANKAVKIRSEWREVKKHLTYAQATKGSGNEVTQKNKQVKGISFEAKEVDVKWLEGSYIGRVSNCARVDLISEEVESSSQGRLKAKYLGDNTLLLQGSSGEEVVKLIEENKEWWETNFDLITPWNSTQAMHNKLVWVRCRGLPLNLWSEECFKKIVAPIGSLVSIDESTHAWECIEFARLTIKVPIWCRAWMVVNMSINGQEYNVALEEEFNGDTHPLCCCAKDTDSSSVSNFFNAGEGKHSSDTEWSDNDSQLNNMRCAVLDERTVLSPTTDDNGRPQKQSAMQSGNGNVIVYDRCALLTKNRNYASMPEASPSVPNKDFHFDDNTATLLHGGHYGNLEKLSSGGPHVDLVLTPTKPCRENEAQIDVMGQTNVTSPLSVVNSSSSNEECALRCRSNEVADDTTGEFLLASGSLAIVEPTKGEHHILSNTSTPVDTSHQAYVLERYNTSSTNHMILINEEKLDPLEFSVRRQFWIGESSGKAQQKSSSLTKEGRQAYKRKLIRSVVQSICNSLFDENIPNCNKLFWSNQQASSGSESVKLWELAKELGATFSGEEEQIIKELENMESRDKNQAKGKVGGNLVNYENY